MSLGDCLFVCIILCILRPLLLLLAAARRAFLFSQSLFDWFVCWDSWPIKLQLLVYCWGQLTNLFHFLQFQLVTNKISGRYNFFFILAGFLRQQQNDNYNNNLQGQM